MKTHRIIVSAVLAAAALGAAGVASARTSWSVGISVPGVVVGGSNGYYAPQPYYAPAPVYTPAPTYYVPPPPPAYYAPRPVYYAPPVVYAPPPPYWHHHRPYPGPYRRY